VADLCGRMDHDSYRDLNHQLTKVTTYSVWGARDLKSRGKGVGLSHLVLRPAWRFFKCYVLRGAWREGTRGLVLSAVDSWSGFAKYALLWDLERREEEARAMAGAEFAERQRQTVPARTWSGAFEPAALDRRMTAERVTGAA
jgi:hypothetical protein